MSLHIVLLYIANVLGYRGRLGPTWLMGLLQGKMFGGGDRIS